MPFARNSSVPSSGLKTSLSAAAIFALPVMGLFFSAAWGRDGRVTAAPHAFMQDGDQCTFCHTEKPVWGQDDFTPVAFSKKQK